MIAALFRRAPTVIKMKTERRLRGKDMDYHQFSTFHYWYGYCMKEIKQLLPKDFFLHFLVAREENADEDRMPHGTVET